MEATSESTPLDPQWNLPQSLRDNITSNISPFPQDHDNTFIKEKKPFGKNVSSFGKVAGDGDCDINKLLFKLAGNPDAIVHNLFLAAYHDNLSTMMQILDMCGGRKDFLHMREHSTNRSAIWYAASGGSNRCLRLLLEKLQQKVGFEHSHEDGDDETTITNSAFEDDKRDIVSISSIVNIESICGTTPLLIGKLIYTSQMSERE